VTRTLNSHEYVYNPGNQRTQQVFNVGSTYNYTYDAIGQLTFGDSATASEDRRYIYDAAWNLNYRTNNTTLYTFRVDTKNQLTNATPVGVQTYDDNGNLVQGHAVGPDLFYTYDDENQLVEMEREEVWKAELVYDGKGRLRVRKEYDFTDDWSLTSETRYVYDGMRVIQERNSGNTPTASYTRGSDLSGSLEGAGGIGGLLARSHGYSGGTGNWSTHNCYHADGNGNITYLVNSSQTLAASYRYDPYGNTISSSGTLASANVYRFSSKEFHANSGLYYYGYRWYHPNLQRWPNRDPLGELGFELLRRSGESVESSSVNLYRFVGNDPLRNVDSIGLQFLRIAGPTGTLNGVSKVCSLVSKTDPINHPGSENHGKSACIWRCREVSPEISGCTEPISEITYTKPGKSCPRPPGLNKVNVRPYRPPEWGDDVYE
jgi:RHS repeat-associated protein